MKKLIITILLIIPIILNAQIEPSESYAFKKDKFWHSLVGGGMGASIYTIGYIKTGDPKGSFNAACVIPMFPILFKEIGDCIIMNKDFSLADIAYGEGSAIITAAAMRGLTSLIKTIKNKKRIKPLPLDNETWSLDNKFINNNR